jgi:hypothetical protein
MPRTKPPQGLRMMVFMNLLAGWACGRVDDALLADIATGVRNHKKRTLLGAFRGRADLRSRRL